MGGGGRVGGVGGGIESLNQCEGLYIVFFIKYLLHNLLTIVTEFFVKIIKISVLLKLSILKNYISFVLKITNQ